MSDPLQLPPTRAALLELRRAFEQVRLGHGLLERKREALLRELWNVLSDLRQTEREVRARFAEAYALQREARLEMGAAALHSAGLAPAAVARCTLASRTVMGVALPRVALDFEPLPFAYSPAGIAVVFDRLRLAWVAAARTLGAWAEMSGAVARVTTELERTQRRVKALETFLLPRYRAAIRRIETLLEEEELESFVLAKRVKSRQPEEAG